MLWIVQPYVITGDLEVITDSKILSLQIDSNKHLEEIAGSL